jgi:putative transposase
MLSPYRIIDPECAYLLTCTVVELMPAFIGQDACGILLDSLTYCRKHKGLKLYAYVIMENHIHLVAQAPDLDEVIQRFKSFTAKEILTHSRAKGKEWLLNRFEYYKQRHRTESTFQVWQQGHYPKLIQSDAMLCQKIEYVRNNPVRRGWELPEHWRYSSARN